MKLNSFRDNCLLECSSSCKLKKNYTIYCMKPQVGLFDITLIVIQDGISSSFPTISIT